jgi:antitoxin component YwqK of YwqJK toxin-antitoxin module
MRNKALLLTVVSVFACSNQEVEQLKKTTTSSYDKSTGKLKELTYDANKNGRIDTWTDMDGARPVRSRIDKNEDGKLDRWEYYDDKGQLQKVGFSRKDDGKPDAWAYSGAAGRVERIEISTIADEKRIDRWERYAAGGLVAADEDRDGNGAADKWETFEGGALKTAAFDENRDGKPDRRMTYQGGALVLIETEPDANGQYAKRVVVK